MSEKKTLEEKLSDFERKGKHWLELTRKLISKNLLISSQNCPPKRGAKPRARRLIHYGGVCWTISEPFLSKIQILIDAKLFRNFADGSRAKIFLPLNPSNFCPLAEKFLQNFWVAFINHLINLYFFNF